MPLSQEDYKRIYNEADKIADFIGHFNSVELSKKILVHTIFFDLLERDRLTNTIQRVEVLK